MRPTLADLLQRKVVVLDGALGTELQARDLIQGLCPEELNVTAPEAIAEIHRAYVDAGADIVETNSFGGNRIRLRHADLEDRVWELNVAAARLAREAAGDRALVAGSVGPMAAILEPLGDVPYAEAVEAFGEQAAALAEGGADLFIVETMYDLNEVRAAVEGIRRTTDLPILCSMTFDQGGRTMMGVRPADAVAELQALGVAALGTNCGNGPEETEQVVREMLQAGPKLPLVAYPNAGRPELRDGRAVYTVDSETMAAYARRYVELGVRIVGACCGSTPAHVAAIARAVREARGERHSVA